MAPPERRGESIGIYGLAIAVPNLVAVPAGVALVLDGHIGWLSWLAAVAGAGRSAWFRCCCARSGRSPRAGAAGPGRAAALAALPPSVVLFVVTLAGGGLVTFLPIERPDGALATGALLLFGVTGAVSRWRAGLLADRLDSRLLLPRVARPGRAGAGVLRGGTRGRRIRGCSSAPRCSASASAPRRT